MVHRHLPFDLMIPFLEIHPEDLPPKVPAIIQHSIVCTGHAVCAVMKCNEESVPD